MEKKKKRNRNNSFKVLVWLKAEVFNHFKNNYKRKTISYHCVLCKGKMKCNHLSLSQGKFALGKPAHCKSSFTLEQALPCNQNHKIPVSC